MTDLVRVDHDGAVATVTLCDPRKRNALSKAMREDLLAVLAGLNADPSCSAIVITGADGTFCSGGDISDMSPRTQLVSRERLVVTTDLARLMLTGPKPIVTAVEGAAIGAGVSVAAASDYCVVARDARLACAFARVGLLPDCAALWTVPRRVGLAKAQELFGLARTIDGAEAHRIGLANEVAEPGATLARAQAVAQEYTQVAPVPLAVLRGALAQGFASLEAAIQFELVAQPLVQRTADHAEAVAGYREKRTPRFVAD